MPLGRVGQLPDIARPVMGQKARQLVTAGRAGFAAQAFGKLLEKMLEQKGDVLTALAQRWQVKLRYVETIGNCLLYTSPSPRDATLSRMPSSA